MSKPQQKKQQGKPSVTKTPKPQQSQTKGRNQPQGQPQQTVSRGSTFNFLNKLFGDTNAPQTTQDTIPYREMRKDGIAVLGGGKYSKTIEFYDINYHLAKPEEQIRIFEAYSDILNYFDDTIEVQFSFINSFGNIEEIEKGMTIFTNRRKSKLHREFADMVKNQLEKGNNGLTKRKFLSFTIVAKDIKQAKTRLERIEIDVINNFKLLGVNKAYSLDGHGNQF